MTEHVFKNVELVGTSKENIPDSIQSAITRVSATLRNLRWLGVVEVRGGIADGAVQHFQVTLKLRPALGRDMRQ